MPRFYFDVQDDDRARDDEGSEFESADAAVHAAARSAAEIGTSRLMKGDFSDVVIEVKDENRQRIATVKASMEVEWDGPPNRGPHAWSA